MVGLYCASFAQVATRIILAIDDSFDAVHGGRQLRLFNAHCDDCGFPPIVVFDGAGRFATAVLRPAKRREIRSHWPRGEILLRARGARAAAAHDADLTTAAPARPETSTPEPDSPEPDSPHRHPRRAQGRMFNLGKMAPPASNGNVNRTPMHDAGEPAGHVASVFPDTL